MIKPCSECAGWIYCKTLSSRHVTDMDDDELQFACAEVMVCCNEQNLRTLEEVISKIPFKIDIPMGK